jgi:hypothetical protein
MNFDPGAAIAVIAGAIALWNARGWRKAAKGWQAAQELAEKRRQDYIAMDKAAQSCVQAQRELIAALDKQIEDIYKEAAECGVKINGR